MRENILTALTFVFVSLLTLTGCGTTSNSDGPTTASMGVAVEMQKNQIVANGEDFTLVLPFTKNLDDTFHVELSNFNLIVSGCTLDAPIVYDPATLVLDGGLGTIELLNISGSFDQNCTPTGYTFKATQTVTKDGETLSEPISFLYDAEATVTDGYTLTVNPQVINIAEAGSSVEIDIFVGKDNQPAEGENVLIDFAFTTEGKGSVNDYNVTTDDSGHASITYTAPADISTFLNTSTTITLKLESDTSISRNTIVNFTGVASGAGIVTNMYVLPEFFTVTSPGTVQEITIVTVDANNNGISTNVQFEQPTNSTDYGSFDTTAVTTDATGRVVVQYTAPSDITSLVERNITVTELSQNISKDLNIKFTTNTTPGQTTNYEIVADIPGSFAVDSIDKFGIKISEIGNPSNVIANANVDVVNLTSTFSNMLVFANDTDTTTYTTLGENTNIQIKSKTLSGVAIIEVSASIFDGTNDVIITGSIPVTIISGPVTAMSMVYIGSIASCISTPQLHGDKYLIHAIDKYANPAQEVRITPTLINGRKVTQENTGQINNPGTPDFSDGSVDFIASNVTTEDRLIVTLDSNHYDPSYLGNWSLNSITANELEFDEIYTGITTSGLSYVVGDEKRVLGSDLALAHIVDPTNKYITDSSGALEVEVCFDPALAMHTVTLAAHVIDRGVRTGISAKKAFRWSDFTSSVTTIDNDGSTQSVSVGLSIDGDIIEPLIDLDVLVSSFIVKTEPHCQITTTANSVTTDGGGYATFSVSTDGNTSATGGVDQCTVEWNTEPSSILYEY